MDLISPAQVRMESTSAKTALALANLILSNSTITGELTGVWVDGGSVQPRGGGGGAIPSLGTELVSSTLAAQTIVGNNFSSSVASVDVNNGTALVQGNTFAGSVASIQNGGIADLGQIGTGTNYTGLVSVRAATASRRTRRRPPRRAVRSLTSTRVAPIRIPDRKVMPVRRRTSRPLIIYGITHRRRVSRMSSGTTQTARHSALLIRVPLESRGQPQPATDDYDQ